MVLHSRSYELSFSEHVWILEHLCSFVLSFFVWEKSVFQNDTCVTLCDYWSKLKNVFNSLKLSKWNILQESCGFYTKRSHEQPFSTKSFNTWTILFCFSDVILRVGKICFPEWHILSFFFFFTAEGNLKCLEIASDQQSKRLTRLWFVLYKQKKYAKK